MTVGEKKRMNVRLYVYTYNVYYNIIYIQYNLRTNVRFVFRRMRNAPGMSINGSDTVFVVFDNQLNK